MIELFILSISIFQKCNYCNGSPATIGCSVKTCKRSFHYPCGLKEGGLFEFIDNYSSYCGKHRPILAVAAQSISPTLKCLICFDDFKNDQYPIKPPCCSSQNNALFHRKCIMVNKYKKYVAVI